MHDEIQFSRLDYAFARFLTQLSKLDSEQGKRFESIVLQLSYALSDGHSCIVVNSDEQSILLASGLADDSGTRTLVLENSFVYLQRYWSYESQLAKKYVP